MPVRVSPTERIRAEIDGLFGSGSDIAEVLEVVMRLSTRLVLQQVLEDEVTGWLGRPWNSRAEGERTGQRNGYSDLTIKTTAGPVELQRPKLRNTTERFVWNPNPGAQAGTRAGPNSRDRAKDQGRTQTTHPGLCRSPVHQSRRPCPERRLDSLPKLITSEGIMTTAAVAAWWLTRPAGRPAAEPGLPTKSCKG